jgi:hypothetical protein
LLDLVTAPAGAPGGVEPLRAVTPAPLKTARVSPSVEKALHYSRLALKVGAIALFDRQFGRGVHYLENALVLAPAARGCCFQSCCRNSAGVTCWMGYGLRRLRRLRFHWRTDSNLRRLWRPRSFAPCLGSLRRTTLPDKVIVSGSDLIHSLDFVSALAMREAHPPAVIWVREEFVGHEIGGTNARLYLLVESGWRLRRGPRKSGHKKPKHNRQLTHYKSRRREEPG